MASPGNKSNIKIPPTRPKSAGIKKGGTEPGTKYGAGQPSRKGK